MTSREIPRDDHAPIVAYKGDSIQIHHRSEAIQLGGMVSKSVVDLGFARVSHVN